ncbi:MAG: enoyl-CoA hydratase-related protein [Alphaproteobacteria bacterium]|nr:enoyl-CoA hydratase-related protein [Alphaproteobacteria bacterium]
MSASTDENVVLVEREGDIATVVLNRPEKLNALNKAMWRRLGDVMAELDSDQDVRCVVLRGAGDKAMGPGADIAEFETERSNSQKAAEYGALMHRSMHAIRDCRHPVIALIKGLCVGGTLELALMCDIRICGEGSRFGVPINRLGLVMAHPEVEALVGLVGRSVALEILFEARVFDAAEAKDKGLINRVVPDDQVEAEAYAAARRIADGAPLVNRWHKKFADRVLAGAHSAAPLTAAELAEGYACFDTEDYNTGYQAFLAKKKPKFEGK